MNALVISHTYSAKINRDKWKVLSRLYPNVKLTVVFPKTWPDTLFTLENNYVSNEDLQNCKFIALDAFKVGNEVLYGYYPKDLIKLLRTSKPDIIHVEQGDNAFSYFQTIILSKIFCPKAKRIFFTWINWKVKHGFKYKLLWKWIEWLNLKFSSGALVGNRDAADVLESKKFYKPCKVLPQLGVDLNFFKPAKRCNENIIVAFIGRFTPEKGIYLLADAFNRVADKYETNLVFVGCGKGEQTLRTYINKLSCSNRVKFVISATHEKIRDILQTIDILVLPSYDTDEWKEQFGHVIIEAMASRTVVIGSDAGEIPNVISNAGMVFKQKNVDDLAHCLDKLILNRNMREKFADMAYRRVLEKYSHEAIARGTHSFWKEMLDGHKNIGY